MDTSTSESHQTISSEESNRATPELITIKEEVDEDVILIEDDDDNDAPPANLTEQNAQNTDENCTDMHEVKVIWHQKKYSHLEVGAEDFESIVIYEKQYQQHCIACYRGHEYVQYHNQRDNKWFCHKAFDCPAMLILGEGKTTNKIFMDSEHTCSQPIDYPEVDFIKTNYNWNYTKLLLTLNVVYHTNVPKKLQSYEGFHTFANGILILDDTVEPVKAYLNKCNFTRHKPHFKLDNIDPEDFYTFNCCKDGCFVDLYVSKKGTTTKLIIEINKHTGLKSQPKAKRTGTECPIGYNTATTLTFCSKQDLALYEKLEVVLKKNNEINTNNFIYIHESNTALIYEDHIYNRISQSDNSSFICHYNTAPKCSGLLNVRSSGNKYDKSFKFVSLVYEHTCPRDRPAPLRTTTLSYVITRIQTHPNFKRQITPLCETIARMTESPDNIFEDQYSLLQKLEYISARYILDLTSPLKDINKNFIKAELLEQRHLVPYVIVCADLANNRRLELYKRDTYVVDYTAPITDLRICRNSTNCMAALSWKTDESKLVIIGKHTCNRQVYNVEKPTIPPVEKKKRGRPKGKGNKTLDGRKEARKKEMLAKHSKECENCPLGDETKGVRDVLDECSKLADKMPFQKDTSKVKVSTLRQIRRKVRAKNAEITPEPESTCPEESATNVPDSMTVLIKQEPEDLESNLDSMSIGEAAEEITDDKTDTEGVFVPEGGAEQYAQLSQSQVFKTDTGRIFVTDDGVEYRELSQSQVFLFNDKVIKPLERIPNEAQKAPEIHERDSIQPLSSVPEINSICIEEEQEKIGNIPQMGIIIPDENFEDADVVWYRGYKYDKNKDSRGLQRCLRSRNCTGRYRYNEAILKGAQVVAHSCNKFAYKLVRITISSCSDFNQVPNFNPADDRVVTMLINVGNNHNILYYNGFTYIDDRSLSCDRGDFLVTLKSCNMIYMCAKSNVCSAGLTVNLRESEALEIGLHTCTITNNLTEKSKLFREFKKIRHELVIPPDGKNLVKNEHMIYFAITPARSTQPGAGECFYMGHKYLDAISGCSFSRENGCKTLFLCTLNQCTAGLLIDSRAVSSENPSSSDLSAAMSVLEVGLHSCNAAKLQQQMKKITLRNDLESSINQMLKRLADFTSNKTFEMRELEKSCQDALAWLEDNPYIPKRKLEESLVWLNRRFQDFHLSTPNFVSMVNTTLVNVMPAVFINDVQNSTVLVQTKMPDQLGGFSGGYCLLDPQPNLMNVIPPNCSIMPSNNNLPNQNEILPTTQHNEPIKRIPDQTIETCVKPPVKKRPKITKPSKNPKKKSQPKESDVFPEFKKLDYVIISSYKPAINNYVFVKAVLYEEKIYVRTSDTRNATWKCRFESIDGCTASILVNKCGKAYFTCGKHLCTKQSFQNEVEVHEEFHKRIGSTAEDLWDSHLIPVFDEKRDLHVIYKGFVYGNCSGDAVLKSTVWSCIHHPCATRLMLKDGQPSTFLEHTCLNLNLTAFRVFCGRRLFYLLGQYIYTPKRLRDVPQGVNELDCLYTETLKCRGQAEIKTNAGNPVVIQEYQFLHTCKGVSDLGGGTAIVQVEESVADELLLPEKLAISVDSSEECSDNFGEMAGEEPDSNNGLSNVVISEVYSLSECQTENIDEQCDTQACENNRELAAVKIEVEEFQSNDELNLLENVESMEIIPKIPKKPKLPRKNKPKLLRKKKAKLPRKKTKVDVDLSRVKVEKSLMKDSRNSALDESLVLTTLEADEVDDIEDAIPVTYVLRAKDSKDIKNA